MHTTMWFFGMAFWFPILFYLGGHGGNPRQTSLRMMKKRRRSYVFKLGTVPCCAGPCLAIPRIRDSCSGHAGFRAWLLSTGSPQPANTKMREDERSTRDLRSTWVLAMLGPAVPGIRGIAVPAVLVSGLGCLPWGRCARETQTRVDRRSTHVFCFLTPGAGQSSARRPWRSLIGSGALLQPGGPDASAYPAD